MRRVLTTANRLPGNKACAHADGQRNDRIELAPNQQLGNLETRQLLGGDVVVEVQGDVLAQLGERSGGARRVVDPMLLFDPLGRDKRLITDDARELSGHRLARLVVGARLEPGPRLGTDRHESHAAHEDDGLDPVWLRYGEAGRDMPAERRAHQDSPLRAESFEKVPGELRVSRHAAERAGSLLRKAVARQVDGEAATARVRLGVEVSNPAIGAVSHPVQEQDRRAL
jgi:hypothetical protein